MAAVLIRGALIFTMSITSWLQCRSFSLVAQILHPTAAGFLASTPGHWAFPVQILNRDVHETLPWAQPLAGLLGDTALDSKPLAGCA
ncbi:hypothetical protein H920_13322 [Fukomys damarensis]|uniref:Secreted protein n=1 Tax=Fukomys damarensis TaxID=885580 RepID=A0A091CZN4_FUKDA|nr:hypothetical protein H920_13322 [Fukomys damarensis]